VSKEPSWDETVRFLRGTWPVTFEEPDCCGLSLEVDRVIERVAIRRARSGELSLFTQVCSQELIQPIAALTYNQASERWTLGIWRGTYVLRAPIRSPNEPDIKEAIHAAISESARLRAGRARLVPTTAIHWRADWCA
jgi:hypothetical protein